MVMTTLYVIFNYGTDYNDETHTIGGENAQVLNKGYNSLEDAKAGLRLQLKDSLKNFTLSDFGYECEYEYAEAYEWLKNLLGLAEHDHHYCSYSYRDIVGCNTQHGWNAFIAWCEANDVEWLDKVPQLLCIQEINV
jgi:hypothetical protein